MKTSGRELSLSARIFFSRIHLHDFSTFVSQTCIVISFDLIERYAHRPCCVEDTPQVRLREVTTRVPKTGIFNVRFESDRNRTYVVPNTPQLYYKVARVLSSLTHIPGRTHNGPFLYLEDMAHQCKGTFLTSPSSLHHI